MGIYSIKPKFQQFLSPVTDLLVLLKIHPTWINILALVLSALAGLALYLSYQNIWLLCSVPPLVLARLTLNALDGLVSRRMSLASRFGEVLNEISDRVSDAAILLGISLAPGVSHRLGAVTAIGVLLNSYLGTVSKAAGGTRQYGGLMGKADRMIYLSLAAVLALILRDQAMWDYFLAFVLAGTSITFVQRFLKIRRELR